MQSPRNWDLTRKEGWRAFVLSERRPRPQTHAVSEIKNMTENAASDYNERRLDFHANFGIIRTPQLISAHERLDMVFDTGLRVDSDRVKPSAVLDADAGVGKSTTINEYLRDYERSELRRFDDRTANGDQRIPVCRIGMTAKSGLKPLTANLLRFYGGPQAEYVSYNRSELYEIVQNYVFRCETRIVFVDDVHFLDPNSRDGLAVSNFFKGWTNDLGIGLIMAGVDLARRGIYTEGMAMGTSMAQNGRRWTPITMAHYTNKGRKGRRDWKDLLGAYEANLILAEHKPMDLIGLADLMHDRTGGYLVSLNHLITRASALAIRRGTERITRDIIEVVPLDFAAEAFWEARAQSNLKGR